MSTINDSRVEFMLFLQDIRPSMPTETAAQIAYELCDDLSMVGDSQALTARLGSLLQRYGY